MTTTVSIGCNALHPTDSTAALRSSQRSSVNAQITTEKDGLVMRSWPAVFATEAMRQSEILQWTRRNRDTKKQQT